MEKLILTDSQKMFLIIGAILGFLAVAAGAFGAHALKNKLSQEYHNIFEVAVRYQMYHALALMLTAILLSYLPDGYLFYAGIAFIIGTVIFSGSLYILALTGIRAWGAVTPIGGALFLLGWLLAIIAMIKSN